MEMRTILALATSLIVMGCATATLKRIDPAFSPGSLEGKKLVFQNLTELDFSGINLDVAYAGGVFKKEYPEDTAYTNPFLDRFADSLVAASRSSKAGMFGKGDSITVPYDYRITQEKLDWHSRCGVDAYYSVFENGSGKKVCEIMVPNLDKFGLGGEGRFKKAFVNLRNANARQIKKDWAGLVAGPAQ